jgi:general secretion pathway protein G
MENLCMMHPLLIKLNQNDVQKRRRALGFTLIELLVVIAILAMLAAVVGVNVMGRLGKTKSQAAALQIADFEKTLDVFKLDIGRYPTNAEGLQALITRTSDSNWNGPYLKSGSIPADPWGNPYHYANPGPSGDIEIISYGADNQPGGTGENADITNVK